MIDEDERLEAAFTDAQYQLLFAEDSRATMLPRDEPLADGHTKQVWTLEKTG